MHFTSLCMRPSTQKAVSEHTASLGGKQAVANSPLVICGAGIVNSEGHPLIQVRETLRTTLSHDISLLKKYALAHLTYKPTKFQACCNGIKFSIVKT